MFVASRELSGAKLMGVGVAEVSEATYHSIYSKCLLETIQSDYSSFTSHGCSLDFETQVAISSY